MTILIKVLQFFLSLSMKKTVKVQDTEELPKIKGPKVLSPKKKEVSEEVQNTEENRVEKPDGENNGSVAASNIESPTGQTEDCAAANSTPTAEGDEMPE